jgi:hypothetical protein
MSPDGTDAQIDELLAKAYAAEGEERLSVLEEAARLADQRNNVEAGMEIRDQIVDAATWAGFYEKSLIAFNWMLAQWDRNPDIAEGYLEHRLLWLYKWILDDLHRFPQITRQQVEQTFADMERRYTKAGQGLRAVYQLRCMAAQEMGDADRAAEFERKWDEAERDSMGDCPACELNSRVKYLLDGGDTAAALKKAGPLLKGRMRCTEVPGITHSRLLVPLLRAGKLEQAVASQKSSYRQMRESRKFILYLGQHLAYFALVGEMTKAVKLLEARLGWAMENRILHDRLGFLMAARVLLARLAAGGKKKIKLNLPPSFPGRTEDGQYATAELADRFLAISKEIAEAFNQRNGNDRYSKLVRQNEELIALPTIALKEEA